MANGTTQEAPAHIAIIMDGNGRWAKARGLPRIAGHQQGAEAVRAAVKGAIACGVRYLTLYAFSTENWQRPADEVTGLMGLLRLYIQKEIKSLHKNGVCVRFIGEREGLASDIVEMIEKAEAKTAANEKLTLVIALNYGSRIELTSAVKLICKKVQEGQLEIDDITEDQISCVLNTHDIPDPDLIIRTSGEQRLSNFLLWQSAYSEFLFLDLYWPDFDQNAFKYAVESFQKRERRFGARS